MTHVRDHFVTWLRSAHAMEEQAIAVMGAQVRRIESYPDIRHQLERDLERTHRHLKVLTELLERFSATNSGVTALRDMAARLTGRAQGISGLLTSDEIVKNVINGYSFIHLQIAQYKVLIAAADVLDDTDAAELLSGIVDDKTAMAAWLEGNLDFVTRVFLMRDERELMARR